MGTPLLLRALLRVETRTVRAEVKAAGKGAVVAELARAAPHLIAQVYHAGGKSHQHEEVISKQPKYHLQVL